jgi:hypothetical protein
MWKKKHSKICQEMREKGHKALPRNEKKGTQSKAFPRNEIAWV